jgi:hypothetical protein
LSNAQKVTDKLESKADEDDRKCSRKIISGYIQKTTYWAKHHGNSERLDMSTIANKKNVENLMIDAVLPQGLILVLYTERADSL